MKGHGIFEFWDDPGRERVQHVCEVATIGNQTRFVVLFRPKILQSRIKPVP